MHRHLRHKNPGSNSNPKPRWNPSQRSQEKKAKAADVAVVGVVVGVAIARDANCAPSRMAHKHCQARKVRSLTARPFQSHQMGTTIKICPRHLQSPLHRPLRSQRHMHR